MANEQTRGTTDFATHFNDGAGDMKDKAREVVQEAKVRAGERIESRISDSKTRAAQTLSGVASTLLSSSEQLRNQNQPGASRAIERAAEGVERFANYLQDTNVDDVVDQVHEFARRQPAAFIGGAFALGFIASRFIKATSPEGARHRNLPAQSETGYETSYNTTRIYDRSGGGYGNSGDVSGSLGYGAGLSRSGGGYGNPRGTEQLGDGSPAVDRTGGSDAGSR